MPSTSSSSSIYDVQRISPNTFDINSYYMYDKIVVDDIALLRSFVELCLRRCDFTSADDQSKERLRSMRSDLEVIWLQDQQRDGRTFLNRVMDPTPEEKNRLDFRSLFSQLKKRIHQSKLLIEGWCVNYLLPNPMPSTCSSTIDCYMVQHFLRLVKGHRLRLLSRRRDAAGNVPFKKYIHILNYMIDILLDLLNTLESNNCSIEFLKLYDFACVFYNKAECLTCFYWAKHQEDVAPNANTSTEMNTVLFAMINEFIPSAPDVIAWSFRLLRSTSTTESSVFLQETVESFVGFFFGHLEITLVDEFPILRDHLIYLFTFITDDHSREKDMIIRSQIYTLFKEDPYTLLSFDEMKEDFYNNNNIILKDFIRNVEIAYANIRQGYYAFSYSWIGSEAVKMDYSYFVLLKRTLSKPINKSSLWCQPVWDQLRLYIMELGFLKASLLWFVTLDDRDEEIRSRLNLVIISLQGIWGKEKQENGLLAVRLHEIFDDEEGKGSIADWHVLALELEGKIELSKQEISTQLVYGFYWSFQNNKPSTSSDKVLKFLESIIHNLNALVRYKASKILSFKKQIETLQDKLAFMHNIMKLVDSCIDSNDLSEFILFGQVFANEAAHLTLLYWLKEANEKTASEISLILSHTLHMIKPVTPDVVRLYFETLIYLQRSDPLLFGQTASIFVDFLLEDSVTLFKDDFQILQDEVIYLLTFLNSPPKGEELICSQIDNTFWDDVYDILPIDDTERDFSCKKVCLSGFIMKIQVVNAKIRNLYCEFPDSLLYGLPKIMSPWYLDFLIQNLRNLKERMTADRKFVPFVKYKTIKIEEELVSLRPLFNYIFELQNELNDTWLEVVDLVYLTERVINWSISSWFVFDHPIWYYMSYLSHVFDKIKVIKIKLEKIKENNICYLPRSVDVIGTHLKHKSSSEFDEVVVGFDGIARNLIVDLTCEHKPLDIISIVGMGGSGKTTLARKVSLSLKDHFHVVAFYTVSQYYNTRMLRLGILKCIIKVDDEISRMDTNDLAHKLKKCLSRRKYLIVLDDVWSTSVWNEVRISFPDDNIGSRVVFTTRFYDVANKCKINCNPFPMPFLSKDESWELLQKKVFQDGISPPHLSNIGRQIAKSCKGLPLAIVVIAGVLARKERSESSWSEITGKVFSFLSDEGCIEILELSYNYLPEYLKPCILYLGAFLEDKLFRVDQVIQLWIDEGFIHECETKSVEDIAKEYFQDLVDRSLVIISSRGSDGEIKTFNVHDLIHKLCQAKCREGNFFNLGRGIAASSSLYNHYRISDLVVPLSISGGSSSHEKANTLLLFTNKAHNHSSFKKLRLVQVLYLESNSKKSYLNFLTCLVNLRHIEYNNLSSSFCDTWLPPCISNLWNLQSLILSGECNVPETLWKMKSLRHVKIREFRLQFSDDHEHEQLDKVISFSRPVLYSAKEIVRLLQRLPVVRKLGINLKTRRIVTLDTDDVVTLDFLCELESLKIYTSDYDEIYGRDYDGKAYLIRFPLTLKKLTLEGISLHFTCISSIAELKCLRVLKLRDYSFFMGPTLEMEELVFSHLVFFELYDNELEQWTASIESFPCLEQLSIHCTKLEELPPCFGEISTLKRVAISDSSTGVDASALRIREELMDLGNKVEVTIDKKKVTRSRLLARFVSV